MNARGGDISRFFAVLNTFLSDKDASLIAVGPSVSLTDNSCYQLFAYTGRYYIYNASFRCYPFMDISLPVAIEVNDVDGELGYCESPLNTGDSQ